MSHVRLAQILQQERKKGAVGAFNVHNLEFIQGVIHAAEEAQKPVILMIGEPVLRYGKIHLLGNAAIQAAKYSTVPVAVMVDHGKDKNLLQEAIRAGMDVMYDGSGLPYEENVRNTRDMAAFAHEYGCSIEGEIGALGLSEDGEEELEQKLTTVEDAIEFSKAAQIDVLAVSVGNVHGFYKGEAKIDIPRIEQIAKAVSPLPVVMHGGSDIPEKTVRAAIQAGIRKFNFATDLKKAYADKMTEIVSGGPVPMAPVELFSPLARAVQDAAAGKLKMMELS